MEPEKLDQSGISEESGADYSVTARFYDLMYDADQTRLDGEFYSGLAAATGGPVLELGCGTGRVALRLAREGHQVTGLDLSAPMLQRFRAKLDQEPAEVRERIELVEGDMTDFRFDRRFGLVVVPFRAFQHILDPGLQRQCLRRVAEHLAPMGRFVFNAFNPDLRYITDAMEHSGFWKQANEAADPGTGEIIRRYYQLRPDQHRQMHNLRWKFEVYDRFGKLAETYVEEMQLRWLYRWEAEYLLELSGLRIVAAYGGFDKRAIDDRPGELIFVCQRIG